ncbi:transketolase family protein [Pseudonocardia sp. TRM90224]|uniref:transketolase family protein n=1 Tax=Pseudonocardia sp. TRM90224 TaxID=2812678 RepID=UPI001E2ADE4C|nr:transketolase C-terminal domain-containing protein [Pseudonocardia sp. TRM90224]
MTVRSTRDWFGDALVELADDHDDVMVVNCDLASATRTSRFAERHPDRFVECGIAEANAIGIAAGLAQEGYRPFVASFAHFITGKYLEIFQSIGLNGAGVVVVGTHAGLAIGQDGPTQMGLRDLALMRTLPNVEILQPADGHETRQMLEHLVSHHRPSYLRLCRQPLREVHAGDDRFVPGRPAVLHRGTDVAVFTMGGMLPVVLDAVDELARVGIHPSVVNASSLPVARAAVEEIARAHGSVFVVEDHADVGGLGDEIARIVAGMPDDVRFEAWGVADYAQAGTPGELYARYQLDTAGVTRRLTTFLRDRGGRS